MDYEKRNRILRAYFEGRDWDNSGEYNLKRKLILEGDPGLAGYPLLYDDEWEVVPGQSNCGKGDLVFTDGQGKFAVVEVKYMNPSTGRTARTRRTKQRKQVVEQAIHYASEFEDRTPEATSVVAMTYSDGSLTEVSREDMSDIEDL